MAAPSSGNRRMPVFPRFLKTTGHLRNRVFRRLKVWHSFAIHFRNLFSHAGEACSRWFLLRGRSLFPRLGSVGLFDADEPAYAGGPPGEMLETGDWVHPRVSTGAFDSTQAHPVP